MSLAIAADSARVSVDTEIGVSRQMVMRERAAAALAPGDGPVDLTVDERASDTNPDDGSSQCRSEKAKTNQGPKKVTHELFSLIFLV